MKNTSPAYGSLQKFILPMTEWCSKLAGIVVSIHEKGWGRNATVKPVGAVRFSEGVKQAEAMAALIEKLAPVAGKTRYISACHLNPTIGPDGLVVDGTGEKVSGRFVFTPDNRISDHTNAMRMYARAIGEIKGKNVLTFGSLDQADEFITISAQGGVEAMADKEAMAERVTFQWSPLAVGSNRPSVFQPKK